MRNSVREAMEVLGGRPEDIAVICRVSAQTVYNWLTAGCIEKARHAVLVAEATLAAGKPIAVRALAGLDEAAKPADPPSKVRRAARSMNAKGGT